MRTPFEPRRLLFAIPLLTAMLTAPVVIAPGRSEAQSPPTCSISGPETTCEDAKLCGPEGNFSWAWTGPGGITSSDRCIEATVSGTYTLVVTDLGSGLASEPCSHELDITNPSTCTITGDDLICDGTTTELCGPEGDFVWAWAGPGGFTASTRCITVGEPGTYELTVTLTGTDCIAKCEHVLRTEECDGGNCPRSPGFWGQQCAQRGNGSTKFTVAQMTQIAECVDDHSTFFDWDEDTDFSGFCSNVTNNGNQLRRHYAAALANFCTGELGLIANNGDEVFLDLDTSIDCDGTGAGTIGELFDAVEEALADNDTEAFEDLKDCLDAINNGDGIGSTCRIKDSFSVPIGAMHPAPILVSPNPLTDLAQFSFDVAAGGDVVELGVYDVAGRLLHRLASGTLAEGRHVGTWNGRDQAGAKVKPGVYFIRGRIGAQGIASRVVVVQ